MKILVFDIWGNYAHFKKIYATTSAVSYAIPPKTSLYGYIWAIACLEKKLDKDYYLNFFQEKSCLLSIEIRKPIVMQRVNTNLVSVIGRMQKYDSKGKPKNNHKPTMIEYVYEPKYRIYFHHENEELYLNLKTHLQKHTSEYSPTLGLANLHSDFEFIGEFEVEKQFSEKSVQISSVIPKRKFIGFDEEALYKTENEIIEQSMFAMEMDLERNVTVRDDIIFDRTAKPIHAVVNEFYQLENEQNVVLF